MQIIVAEQQKINTAIKTIHISVNNLHTHSQNNLANSLPLTIHHIPISTQTSNNLLGDAINMVIPLDILIILDLGMDTEEDIMGSMDIEVDIKV